MSQPYIAEIRMYPFTYAPRDWAWCYGQIIPISYNSTLFSIIGDFYGGDGRVSMALPNLQGRAVMGSGTGPGLSTRRIDQRIGTVGVELTSNQMPTHQHRVLGANGPVDGATDEGNADSVLGPQRGASVYKKDSLHNANLRADTIAYSGSGQAHENRQPYLAIPFCICLDGIYPPRN